MATNNKIVSFLLPNLNWGGVQRSVVNLAGSLVKQGLNVDLVVQRLAGAFLEEVPSEIRIVDMGSPRLRSSISWVWRYLQQEQPIALISNTHYNDEIALLARRFSGVSTKVVVQVHNDISAQQRPSIKTPLAFFGLAPYRADSLVRLFYPWADEIVAVSDGVAEKIADVSGIPPERIRVIYNPVITPELLEKAKAPIEHPWFATGEPPVVLGVGRLVAQKDFPTLIRAFADVRKLQKARLMILGSGSDRPQIESLVQELGLEEDVAIPGYVENPYAYMARSAVFVLSSVWEGLPTVLIEAMAVGTAVVSTDCKSGPAEILDGGKYGPLVPVGDSKAMADAILEVINGKQRKIDSVWLQPFSLEYVTKQYLELLDIA
ncbi:MAG TPA: glycosyltransferase [Leptolyngbyaceae cyanobacterium]